MTTKYHPKEILQIIQANYKQQQQYDYIVLKDKELTLETTILEWRDICDLVDTSKLWTYLNFQAFCEEKKKEFTDGVFHIVIFFDKMHYNRHGR